MMQTYQVPQTDLTVSRIAYGCADLGWERSEGGAAPFSSGEPLMADYAEKAVRIINTAYEAGITFFDLAESYGRGRSEVAFGEVLKRSPGLRDQLVIQSKCSSGRVDPKPGTLDFSREQIVNAAEGTLKRLGPDRLDILLLHTPDQLMEPEEVADAFDILKSCGKVRYFGVSNHTIDQIRLLKKYVRQPLVVNQIQLGLATYPGGETSSSGIVDYCRLHDMQIQAYSPLKSGHYLGSCVMEAPTDAAPEVGQLAQLLTSMAKEKGNSPAALALAWILRHPAQIVPIIGTTKPERILDNFSADRVELSRDEWYSLYHAAAAMRSQSPVSHRHEPREPSA